MHNLTLETRNEGNFTFSTADNKCEKCVWPWTILPPVGLVEISRVGSLESKR